MQKGRQLLRVCYLGPAEESSGAEEPPVLLLVATGGEPLPAVLTHHSLLQPFHWHKKILLAAVFRIPDILVWISILRSTDPAPNPVEEKKFLCLFLFEGISFTSFFTDKK